MAKSTFELIPVVRVEIYWKGNPELMKAFGQFENENNIFAAVPGGSSGPNAFIHYYSAEDAEKIKKWLLEQGVTETKS